MFVTASILILIGLAAASYIALKLRKAFKKSDCGSCCSSCNRTCSPDVKKF